jgi:hypothetical protein
MVKIFIVYRKFDPFLFFRDLILRVILKIVRLSLQDRPPPNTNHLYIENTIKVCTVLAKSPATPRNLSKPQPFGVILLLYIELSEP